MNRYTIPISLFGLLVVFLAIGLTLDPRRVPSPYIGKPAPTLSLPTLYQPEQQVSKEQFRGKVWVVNVWATWCAECRVEHKWLFELAKHTALVGLNQKDEDVKARRWLRELGNPYQVIAVDKEGKVSLDWGVYGVPETFVMDKQGVVRYKHIGAINERVLRDTLLPLIEELNREQIS